jgi:penicillin G amidase
MKRWLIRISILLPLLLLVVALLMLLALRGSLATLDGEQALAGLAQPVEIERDDIGVVTITARTPADAARALGYVHAQERFFEMDLLRRSAAGELAALFGPAAVELDRSRRMHRMRARAEVAVAQLDVQHRPLLDAYVAGVNDGLAALRVRPWSYLLLRSAPQPWRAEDSMLAALAMFFDLHDSENRRELSLLQMRRHLPDAIVDLLARDGSEWDAPLFGEPRPTLSLPDASVIDLRDAVIPPPTAHRVGELEPLSIGSNNFAVSGALTGDGRALVADDMHLGLRAPNIWFRVRLRYPDASGPVDVSGVTLPGTPGIVAGSNGHVAWGFTNAYGDWFDWVQIDWLDADKTRYRTPEGGADVVVHAETIEVRGADPVQIEVRDTRWGPLLHTVPDGSSLALAWTAHRPGAVDLGLIDLATAGDLDAALAIANRVGMPPQNFVAGDASGRIGWTISGRIPERAGNCDPQRPLTDGCHWLGWLPAERYPRLVDPEHGRLWTANSRVADGEYLAVIGDGGYAGGARQKQIRDLMFDQDRFNESDLLAIQLDDRALFLERWWLLLREFLARSDAPELQRLEAATREWEGQASIDAVSYRLTRGFRSNVQTLLIAAIIAPVVEAEGDAWKGLRLSQFEALLWPIVEQRPLHLLPARFDSWDALFAQAALDMLEELGSRPGALASRTWGERNTAAICHPLSRALPGALGNRLCMPRVPLPGDLDMPRAQGTSFGASQRMVVAPGHEADGVMHMPGGQSGHPLSPFWGSGHGEWEQGKATPFLPGAAVHRLQLQPGVR